MKTMRTMNLTLPKPLPNLAGDRMRCGLRQAAAPVAPAPFRLHPARGNKARENVSALPSLGRAGRQQTELVENALFALLGASGLAAVAVSFL